VKSTGRLSKTPANPFRSITVDASLPPPILHHYAAETPPPSRDNTGRGQSTDPFTDPFYRRTVAAGYRKIAYDAGESEFLFSQ